MSKLKIKKDDTVMVIAGVAKGKQGKVLSVNRKSLRAVVEGLNVVKKHMKPQASKVKPEGGIVDQEASIHVSNLMLIDSKSGKPSRVGIKADDIGNNVRFTKKSGEVIE